MQQNPIFVWILISIYNTATATRILNIIYSTESDYCLVFFLTMGKTQQNNHVNLIANIMINTTKF